MERVILHCDCNSFFASVETVLNPALRGLPIAVCGNPENRHGIILAKSEEAKRFGVQTAETIYQAKKKCPDLVLVPPTRNAYSHYSKKVNEIYTRFTDLIEPFGIDESWLDVTGTTHLFGSGKEIADQIRKAVREELGLTVSVGVSFNKVFAKLGSDYKKPDATTVFSRAEMREKVWPLPAGDLLFVGPATRRALEEMNIKTIGQIATADPRLFYRLGKQGEQLLKYARGEDDSPVASFYAPPEPPKSIGNGITFRRDLVSKQDVRTAMLALCDEVSERMRRHGVSCRGIRLTIRDTNFQTITRQELLQNPTQLRAELFEAGMHLLNKCWDTNRAIRMLTVTAHQLLPAEQSFFQTDWFHPEAEEQQQKRARLEETIDRVRNKYGHHALDVGTLLKNDLGLGSFEEEE
ncbi:MAG: DNA polymerase IV [Clostridia bacterium]|nr:DNA polymerase IV [Clostridia bacterium]